jgi:hypothetical protein
VGTTAASNYFPVLQLQTLSEGIPGVPVSMTDDSLDCFKDQRIRPSSREVGTWHIFPPKKSIADAFFLFCGVERLGPMAALTKQILSNNISKLSQSVSQ